MTIKASDFEQRTPKLGDTVVVRITNISNKGMSMSCDLVEYDGYTGIVARVDGRWRTHKAYRQLKIGDITILACNSVDPAKKTVDLSYSTIDETKLSEMKEHYKRIERIKLSMIKIAALKAGEDCNNVKALRDNNILCAQGLQFFNEIYHDDIVNEFYDLTYDMYERSKQWSFYDDNVKLLLEREYKLPQYNAKLDIGLVSHNCYSKQHIAHTITLIENLLKEVSSKYLTRNVSECEVVAGPLFRFTVSDQCIEKDDMDILQKKILELNTQFLDVTMKDIEIMRVN